MRMVVASAMQRAQNLWSLFHGPQASGHKRDHWVDYGYPHAPTFNDFYRMYSRNGIAAAGVDRIVDKCWQDLPALTEDLEATKQSTLEAQVEEWASRLHLWQQMQEVDRRSRVGEYGALLLRFADNRRFRDPVGTVPGGMQGLVEVRPLYSEQLRVVTWDDDERSTTYGEPTMYQLHESAVDFHKERTRSTEVHPDRVLIWSRDGTVWGRSALEPGYNALINIEKVVGAAGEGFWKGAKNSPVLNMDQNASPDKLAKMLGVKQNELPDAIDEMVNDWQRGFDSMLMLQGITADSPAPTLPNDPQNFLMPALQEFSASIPIPMKILLGSQTGERASTEDAQEWSQTAMSRRERIIRPNIMRFVRRLQRFGVLTGNVAWQIQWSDLTEASADDKIARAEKMSVVNKNLMGTGERAFTGDEIREVADREPLNANSADELEPPLSEEDDDDEGEAAE